MNTTYYDQHEYAIRCEWGEHGVEILAPVCDVMIIVDVMSFTTTVDVATSRGASIYPFAKSRDEAAVYAREIGAMLGLPRTERKGFTLSPVTMLGITAGTRLVLPSPNGSTLSQATGATTTIAGCLRNAAAVARVAQRLGRNIGVVPAGERWPDNSLRPALEDLIGAGAIISFMAGKCSPEADAARAVFERFRADLQGALAASSSGHELISVGFPGDVALAAELNVSDTAPVLTNGAFVRYELE